MQFNLPLTPIYKIVFEIVIRGGKSSVCASKHYFILQWRVSRIIKHNLCYKTDDLPPQMTIFNPVIHILMHTFPWFFFQNTLVVALVM